MKIIAIAWYMLMIIIIVSYMFGAASPGMIGLVMGYLLFHSVNEIKDWWFIK